MTGIEKEGYLELHARGAGGDQSRVWQRRYYVLYRATSKNTPRLDWFDTKETFQQQPNVRRTIFLEQITDAKLVTNEERNHTFVVQKTSGETLHLFSASSVVESHTWVRALKTAKCTEATDIPVEHSNDKPPCDPKTVSYTTKSTKHYEVQMNETEAALRTGLQGPLMLRVADTCLALFKPGLTKPVLAWNFRHIRRYGRNANSFTFEAGRRCASGEGVFTVMTSEGDSIFELVQKRTKAMRSDAPPPLPSSPPPHSPVTKTLPSVAPVPKQIVMDEYSEPLPLSENTYSEPDECGVFKMSDMVARMRKSQGGNEPTPAQYDQVDFTPGAERAGVKGVDSSNRYGTVTNSQTPPTSSDTSEYDSIQY